MGPLNAASWDGARAVRLLDQRALPMEERYVSCCTVEDVARAIEDMTVRGAPAIGIAAAYGVALGALGGRSEARAALDRLARTRPTAVDLFAALDRMRRRLEAEPTEDEALHRALLDEARSIHQENVVACRRMGELGAALLPDRATVLTHCNAGALATGGHGTALGILRSAREMGKTIERVYADETRPLFQGARLTAWELARDGFDVTVIAEGMAAALMRSVHIDAVIVGADRIARNGDVANKIGTYGLSIIAAAHDVPFYVAAPQSTFDLSLADGSQIPIEERSHEEMRALPGGMRVPDYVGVWDPAFDVTPASNVSAIITERGVFQGPYRFEP